MEHHLLRATEHLRLRVMVHRPVEVEDSVAEVEDSVVEVVDSAAVNHLRAMVRPQDLRPLMVHLPVALAGVMEAVSEVAMEAVLAAEHLLRVIVHLLQVIVRLLRVMEHHVEEAEAGPQAATEHRARAVLEVAVVLEAAVVLDNPAVVEYHLATEHHPRVVVVVADTQDHPQATERRRLRAMVRRPVEVAGKIK